MKWGSLRNVFPLTRAGAKGTIEHCVPGVKPRVEAAHSETLAGSRCNSPRLPAAYSVSIQVSGILELCKAGNVIHISRLSDSLSGQEA